MRLFGNDPGPSDDDETLADIERAGIDMDPPNRGQHRHGDVVHADDHAHPHRPPGDGELPSIGIVGAGPVGTTLGAAFSRAGWTVAAVASRDPARRERFRSFVPGARAFAEPTALLDEVELVFLCVPDDALAGLAGSLRLYSGQALVHTSGALGADVLQPAMAAGTEVGTFHPLVAFADVDRALAALPGSTIAIEAGPELGSLLADLAEAVGAVPVRLAPGSKAAYHAGAVLAAGGFVALLDAVARLGAVAGLDEPAALALYGRLAEQTLANARELGVARALTGPIARGDAGTLRLHLAALAAHAPDVLPLYRAAAAREVDVAESRGTLSAAAAVAVRAALAESLATRG
ncbi:MAG TPA: DUF2520 domain-containing protein [Candidatus Limnocylindrales bacterium]|nr:DUF2520 domain-containing protein [Candidatus Limnocylindrales bacterium]